MLAQRVLPAAGNSPGGILVATSLVLLAAADKEAEGEYSRTQKHNKWKADVHQYTPLMVEQTQQLGSQATFTRLPTWRMAELPCESRTHGQTRGGIRGCPQENDSSQKDA